VISEQSYVDYITYNSVVDVPGKDKQEIYDKIKLYLVERYNNFREVVQLDDKTNGIIVLKAAMRFVEGGAYYQGWIDYTVKIQVKDEKFKIEMKDLDHNVTPGSRNSFGLGLLNRNPKFTEKGWFKNQHNNAWKIAKDFSANYFKGLTLSITDFLNKGLQDDFQP